MEHSTELLVRFAAEDNTTNTSIAQTGPVPRRSLTKRLKTIFKRPPRRRSFFSSTQASIKSLGTIDLSQNNEVDDCGWYDYDDMDAFQTNITSLERIPSDRIVQTRSTTDENSSFHSSSEEEVETNSEDYTSADSTSPGIHITELLNRISTLYHEGKKHCDQGQYQNAWTTQMEALESISASNQRDSSFFTRQDAMIRYELAKIKYATVVESIACPMEDDDRTELSRLHDQVQNAKCKVSLRNFEYYQSQLDAAGEESEDSSDLNQVYTKLYILHNLGKLCDQDLHRYEDALQYYRRALRIEESVLRTYKDTDNGPDDLDRDNMREFTLRVRNTRKKIGSIHYTSGRFDLALLSSVSS
jgi:tetratricopeptide (TPR) repeat protein